MKDFLYFVIFIALGLLGGLYSGINPIDLSFFSPFTTFALIIGLYSSVVGIDVSTVKKRRWLALIVVTVAVPVQIAITGLLMYLIHPVAISFFASVAITQIDPLSVNTLLQGKKSMSSEAKSILRVWASFDDPVTVLFGFLVLLPLLTNTTSNIQIEDTIYNLGFNILLPTLIYLLKRATNIFQYRSISIITVILVLVLAFLTQAYLCAAILGLLIKPFEEKATNLLTTILYYCILLLVGMATYSFGVDIRLGFLLAILAFFVVQPIATLIVFNGTPIDILRISYSQQNGLTTLLMGVAYQSLGYNVLPILLPAIMLVNTINLLLNKLISWKEDTGRIQAKQQQD